MGHNIFFCYVLLNSSYFYTTIHDSNSCFIIIMFWFQLEIQEPYHLHYFSTEPNKHPNIGILLNDELCKMKNFMLLCWIPQPTTMRMEIYMSKNLKQSNFKHRN